MLFRSGFFGWFNRAFDRSADGYRNSVSYVLKRTGRFGLIYLLLLGGMAYLFTTLPTSFLPEEDQGVFLTMVQLPTGGTQERTQEVLNRVRDHYLIEEKDNVQSAFTVAGFSFAGTGQNMGMVFAQLRDWSERKRPDQSVSGVIQRAMGKFMQIKEAQVFADRKSVV